ncbi:MAG: heme-binding domain-containing protein [Thermoleophilia bacterium]|nr:heme-binding domain-containing protein [Thermoleophilia bacterium]
MYFLGALFAVFLLIQLVPYGRDHANPPVTASPKFQGAGTKALFSTSCGDCHSNLTEWKWYSNVAPVSWLVQSDVDEGRETMNFSEWDKPQPAVDELVEQITEGEMPPGKYTILHSNAKLTDAEKKALVAGLIATYASDPPGGIKGG